MPSFLTAGKDALPVAGFTSRPHRKKLLAALFCLFSSGLVHADAPGSAGQSVLAPGYGALSFSPPEPGTYRLPSLGVAVDGDVLDTEGRALKLHGLMGDKIVLLSFIYSTCSDVNGCPLATAVLHKIKSRLKKEPELAERLRLVTLSFNPGHDTPEAMKAYGRSFQDQGAEWHFLTTHSEQELQPILSGYKQLVQKVYDAQGRDTGTYSHLLRVYLIDREKQIRNIYSVSFLHPDTLINDVKTVLLAEAPKTAGREKADTEATAEAVFSAGDNKTHYESRDYETRSVALSQRKGKPANLIRWVERPPLGLPKIDVPADNPVTGEKIRLGRRLFYDRRLSHNNTFSCAMCHIPEQGFTSNEMATAVGIEGRTVRRNSPTLYNVAYFKSLFHDGRETTLEQQVWGPLMAPNEMGNPSIGYVVDKINRSADYPKQFKKAFGKGPDMVTIGQAIASYERALNSANSPFDRWYYGKDKKALEARAQQGFKLFTGKAGCSQCHAVTSKHALFTDNNLHNTGIGYAEAMGGAKSGRPVQLAPGVFVTVDEKIIRSVSAEKANDLGLYEITQNPADRWKYKTPSLRNVALTAPYMHNGSLASLTQVVEFYNRGGIANENLDPLIRPLNLTADEVSAITAFLSSLTGDNVQDLVADAYAAPVGDAQ
ncbi:cytochrome c peroxidase [Methylosarcina fibrata]|uniref:cytochrome c peroxidase n=1 Tax=Methylosarcina fibrata TaxID=105972 RepID=UPI00037452B8|nr:cytochrome c peroxidase [Methylosarcina fibrata]